ncbi:MAG: efflux RND transporter permease subunit [Candidatus Moranbacteria bacterium]|nr:efflux RND transporter permease subunit [Candidatus Moranbacteria bacterium]
MDTEKNTAAKTSDSAYLDRLEFKPELRKTWLNFFVTNFRVVVLLIILLSGWGIYSYLQLPRESDPEVKIPVAVITDSYPGVSPSDMEELVTKKIETDISGVSGIDKITSTSSNSFSAVTVQFASDQDVDDAVRRLRDQLSKIKNDIPEDANDPEVTQISLDDTPIVTFVITGPYNGFDMRRYAEDIQDELEKIQGIRQVDISGGDEAEFEVSYDPKKLAEFQITIGQANSAISATNRAIPAGNFEGSEFNYPVRSDGRFFDAATLAKIPVKHADNGSIVYLGDIADVKEGAIKKTVFSRFSSEGKNPENAVSIQVIKRTGGNIIETVDLAEKKIGEMIKAFPAGIEYKVTVSQADEINKDFNQLVHDFIMTFILVFGILLLIVGLKEAFVAGLAIPLVFFVTFGVMLATGISLNFLSIFSLLLSLGLLVDDAIVVVSATKQYMKSGKFTPEEAVLLVLNDFKVVLTSTTLATVWAFLPLLFSTGIMGQYIKSIPVTVSVTLVSSLLVALMINHPLAAVLERIRLTKNFFFLIAGLLLAVGIFLVATHSVWGYVFGTLIFVILVWMMLWYFGRGKRALSENKLLSDKEWQDNELIKEKLRKQGNREESTFAGKLIHGIIHFDSMLPVYEKYLRMMTKTKKRRWAVILSAFLLFVAAAALPITGVVKSEFFPAQDADTINISMRAPSGLVLSEMDKIASQVENDLLKYPEIVNFSTLVGNPGAADRIGGSGQDTSNTASIVIKLTDPEKRKITSDDIAKSIRQDVAPIQGATITVSSPRGGPPSGAAFQAQISGDDLQALDKIATDLRPILDSIPGVVNSDISLREAPAEYTFKLDYSKMELYGLDASTIGSALRTAISGTKVSTVIRGNKTVDVVADFGDKDIPTLDSIENLQILNSDKNPVFIKDVAKIELTPSVESITRLDQKKTVYLSSDVEGKTSSNQVVAEFQKKVASDYVLPQGYSISYGGENEQNAESVLSIIRAMAIAFVLIISTLVIQFNSFKKAAIVLVTLPLALIGTFFGLALFGVALSFPGLIGILALFGIVVKNAIILIDKINLNIEAKIPFEDAIIDAGKSRLEAIFITSVCTIAGLIPITLSNAMWTALGSAVIFGLTISSFFTLFIIPTLYMTFIKKEERF